MKLHEQIVEDRCVQLLSGLANDSAVRVAARVNKWARERARLPEPPDPRQLAIEENADATTDQRD